MWSSSLTLLPQSGCFTDWDWASPALGRWRFAYPTARPPREKMPGLENPSDAQTKYLGLEQLLRHAKLKNEKSLFCPSDANSSVHTRRREIDGYLRTKL